MAFNTKKMKFHRHLLFRPVDCAQIYNLVHYGKRLDTPGLRVLVNRYFLYPVTRVISLWPELNIKAKQKRTTAIAYCTYYSFCWWFTV